MNHGTLYKYIFSETRNNSDTTANVGLQYILSCLDIYGVMRHVLLGFDDVATVRAFLNGVTDGPASGGFGFCVFFLGDFFFGVLFFTGDLFFLGDDFCLFGLFVSVRKQMQ